MFVSFAVVFATLAVLCIVNDTTLGHVTADLGAAKRSRTNPSTH